MKKILFTGDRVQHPHYERVLENIIEDLAIYHMKYKDASIIVGDCPTGVDKLVRELAEVHNIPYEVYYADWDQYGKAAGPIRNKAMVDQKPDIVIACHYNLALSKGTRSCVTIAKAADLNIKFVGRVR